MEEQVKHNLIRILGKTIEAIRNEDIKQLKDLSNETIHDATVYQDEYSITLAVLIYTLGKMYERDYQYGKFKGWKIFCFDCFRGLEAAKEKLEAGDINGFDAILKNYVSIMDKVHHKLRNYIQDVLRKARISKASRLVEHGLSIGRTAELLGVTRFELMDYVGKTYIADVQENVTIDVAERLRFARGLFR